MIRPNATFKIRKSLNCGFLFPDACKGRLTPDRLKMYLHFNAGSFTFDFDRTA
jgi:hypothetical protein